MEQNCCFTLAGLKKKKKNTHTVWSNGSDKTFVCPQIQEEEEWEEEEERWQENEGEEESMQQKKERNTIK